MSQKKALEAWEFEDFKTLGSSFLDQSVKDSAEFYKSIAASGRVALGADLIEYFEHKFAEKKYFDPKLTREIIHSALGNIKKSTPDFFGVYSTRYMPKQLRVSLYNRSNSEFNRLKNDIKLMREAKNTIGAFVVTIFSENKKT